MAKNDISRNAPCPCGSGKKYKQCCLEKTVGTESELLWRRLRQTDEQLSQKLIRFAESRCGIGAVYTAWDHFVGNHKDIKFEIDSLHNQAFFPWFYYHWPPGDLGFSEQFEGSLTIADAYLKKDGKYLSEMESRYIGLNCESAFSFHEVLDCQPGTGFTLKDLFLEQSTSVIEKLGSQHIRKGDIHYAKIVRYDQVGILCGAGSIIIPPIHKIPIIDLRTSMRRAGNISSTSDLRKWDEEIRALYFNIYKQIQTPPEIRNTDGDPILFHDLLFRIESPQEVFRSLQDLAAGHTEEELLQDAEYDAGGKLQRVEFSWLEGKRGKKSPLQSTLLGHITIDRHSLIVSVNSANRASRIKAEIAKRAGDQVHYQSTKIKTMAEAKAEYRQSPQEPEPREPEEFAEILNQFMETYWNQWLNEKIPALGNITPRKAVTTKDGREKVCALLDDLERQQQKLPADKSQLKYIRATRKKLGIE